MGGFHFLKENLQVWTLNNHVNSGHEVVISLPVDLFTQEGTICNYNNLLDMFFRHNFHYLTDAIDIYTVKETNELKAGLRQNTYFT